VTKSALKPLLLSAAVASALAVLAAPAYALEAKISGQVNRAIMHADDGSNSEIFHVDNDHSSTRFRFVGSEDIGSGLKAGIVWEVEYQSNDSDQVTLVGAPGKSDTGTTFGERKMEVFFAGAFGQVTLGQGDGAMNGGIEVDLSGTQVIGYAGIGDLGGAIGFGGNSALTLRKVINQQDFESRYDRLRYDSPKLGPLTISISTGSSNSSTAAQNGLDIQEYGIWYSSNLGAAGTLAFAVGFSTKDLDTVTPGSGGDQETTGGSISWLHPSGWNVTFAISNVQNDAGKDSDFNYLKVGYKTGKHAFSADFGMGDDQVAVGDEAKHFGVQYVFAPNQAVDLYAGYKTLSLDRAGGVTFDDINILTVGSRIKF